MSASEKSKIFVNCLNSSQSVSVGSEQQTADRENDAKNCDGLQEVTKRKYLAVLSVSVVHQIFVKDSIARKRRAKYPGQEISGV